MGADNTTSGWIEQPDGRGTVDIIWTCAITIFLSCWTSVCCNNIPVTKPSRFNQFNDKLKLACLGLLGPDFLVMLAAGQWSSARRSVKKFKSLGHDDWTLKHAFFADMGGFALQAHEQTAFPIDAEQLFYLVSKGYLTYPKLDSGVIDEKNKTDGLSRTFAIIQAIIFSTMSAARVHQNLPLTTLELTTLGFAAAMLVASFFWYAKPQDVQIPIVLRTEHKVAEIRSSAGVQITDMTGSTPLEFISYDQHNWIVRSLYKYFVRILIRIKRILLFWRKRPLPSTQTAISIPSNDFTSPDFAVEIFVGVFMVFYSLVFFFAWNWDFPTQTEQLLWRIATGLTLLFATVGGASHWLLNHIYFRPHVRGSKAPLPRTVKPNSKPLPVLPQHAPATARKQASKPQKSTSRELPNHWLAYSTIICALYSISRAYILVEDIIGLRSLPLSAYQTVEWTNYLPN